MWRRDPGTHPFIVTMAEAPSARQAFEQQLNYNLARMQSYRMPGNFGREREENASMDLKEPPKEPNPFNMTAKNFPKKRNHIRSNYNRTRGGTVNAAKALELVRTALQPTLNKEIEQVLKSYQEIFRMAALNIKDNTGETVTEEHINSVLRKSLDEAKTLFRIDTRTLPEKMKYERGDRGASPSVIRRKRQRLDAEKERGASPAKTIRHDPKHIIPEWDPDSINEDTEFIMGVKANKALGFAATRGKLYYRHPELFKYSGDSDDKQWLYEHNLLPITGGKAFLMIAEDIRTLVAQNSEYRDNENLELGDLKGFKVPKTMIEKMRAFMRRAAREAKREKERTAKESETDASVVVPKQEETKHKKETSDEQKVEENVEKTEPVVIVKEEGEG